MTKTWLHRVPILLILGLALIIGGLLVEWRSLQEAVDLRAHGTAAHARFSWAAPKHTGLGIDYEAGGVSRHAEVACDFVNCDDWTDDRVWYDPDDPDLVVTSWGLTNDPGEGPMLFAGVVGMLLIVGQVFRWRDRRERERRQAR